MRKIKLDGKLYSIDISDGKGIHSFSMNGGGGMDIYIDGKCLFGQGYIENKRCLDGKVNYTRTDKEYFSPNLVIDDKRYDNLIDINRLSQEDILKLEDKDRIKTVLFGLHYDYLNYFNTGYTFGKEITFDRFCITYNNKELVVYGSNHNGYIKPDYLHLTERDESFSKVFNAVRKRIKEYFYL